MALEPFMQGLMTESEAIELARNYKYAGRNATVTESFQPGKKYVQVYLPALKYIPRPSRIYQQKIWK